MVEIEAPACAKAAGNSYSLYLRQGRASPRLYAGFPRSASNQSRGFADYFELPPASTRSPLMYLCRTLEMSVW